MKTLPEQINEVLTRVGIKNFAKSISKMPEIYDKIKDYPGDNTSEKIYNYLNPGNNVCHRGNFKVFKSYTQGYGFCGLARDCACSRESVSNKCKSSKALLTPEDKQKANTKREETLLSKYGVINIGQLQTRIHRDS